MTTATTVNVQFQLRADTAANWTAANPILLANEFALETDTKKLKVGDGTTAWASLAYFPSIVTGGTVLGNLEIGSTGTLTFEGSTANDFETTLAVTDPTADRTITLPDQSGTVVVSGNASIVDADIAAGAEIAVSKLANGTANQVLVTDGTDVSWSDDLTLAGNLTVNGTTTTVNTETLVVEDKNIELGVVDTPTDLTADGGGITLKGATDKTINWVDSTDAWTSSERFSVPLGSAASPSLTFTGDENTGIYSPGGDQLALSTNGTQRINIEADGDINIDSGGVFYDATNNRLAIGTTNPGNTLHVAGSARIANSAGGELQLEDSDEADGNRPFQRIVSDSGSLVFLNANRSGTGTTSSAERVRIDSSGRLLVGTSSARSNVGGVTPYVQIEGANTAANRLTSLTYGEGSAASAVLAFNKHRGTGVGQNTVVVNGDSLGRLNFYGADGTNFVNGASIYAEVDGTPGANDMPGRLVFSTTADGASSPTERMRITSDAYIRLASGTGGIQFNGDTASANALDDYEEGTWTPTFVPQTGSFASITYDSTRSGYYTKIGNCVTVWGIIRTDSVDTAGASGLLAIGGLPFSVGTGTQGGGFATALLNWAGEDPSAVRPQSGETFAYLSYRTAIDGADTISDVSDLTAGTADANRVSFQFSYRV